MDRHLLFIRFEKKRKKVKTSKAVEVLYLGSGSAVRFLGHD